MIRWLSAACAFAAVGLAVVGAWLALAPPPPPLAVDDPAVDLGEVAAGTSRPVSWRLINPSSHPRRILSLVGGCGPGGCLEFATPDELAVGPGQTAEVRATLKATTRPGPFALTRPMFLDDGGLRQVPLTVRGVVVAPPDQKEASDGPVPPKP